jgi:hypothetical protein
MTASRFVIRYRCCSDASSAALLVVDEFGDAYLVGRQGLYCRLRGAYGLRNLEPVLRRLGWVPVPYVAPYSLAELQRLLAPSGVTDRV